MTLGREDPRQGSQGIDGRHMLILTVKCLFDQYPRRFHLAFVDDARVLIESRLRELEEEEKKLRGALVHLSGTKPRKGPGRPRGGRSQAQGASVTSSKRRRSRKGGTRSEHALAFIEKNPGSKAADIANALKIKPNYVYRVVGDLTKEGKVRKDGTAYRVVA